MKVLTTGSRFLSAFRVVAAAAALVVLLSSCENTVNPFIDADRFFTVYGYLDTARDTQFVRVIPLRKTIGATGDEAIDATVSMTSLENGRTISLRDSVIKMSDGSIAHVFYAPFRPIPGWTYRLDVHRSDGITAKAETTVPRAERASVSAPRTTPAGLVQTVTWTDVNFPPFRVEVWYRFMNDQPHQPFREVVLTYAEIGQISGENWLINVPLTQDRTVVYEVLGLPPDERLALLGLGLRMAFPDAQWRPPGGVFDADILVQPEVFTNVENGFGFFGSVNQFTIEWTLDADTISKLGYGQAG